MRTEWPAPGLRRAAIGPRRTWPRGPLIGLIVVASVVALGRIPEDAFRIPSKSKRSWLRANQLAKEDFAARSTAHPTETCPWSTHALGSPDEVRDPWGTDFIVECRARALVVISAGPDGRFGTPDDIRSDSNPPEE